MVMWPMTNGEKAFGQACCNADDVRSCYRKLEQFLSEHSADFCLLNETHVEPDRALRNAKYICHRTDRPTLEWRTAILVRRSKDNYAVPVSVLQNLDAAAHALVVGDQTSKARGGLGLAHTTIDRVGPDGVHERSIISLDAGRNQREARGLEFLADHSQG
jgi:hypothetical protein